MQKSERRNDSVCKSEFWGICCESNKRYSQVVCKKFHISMAALDPTDTMTSPCVSLMVERDGCQYLLCSLKPDSILQVILDLYFDKGENITFFLKGHGTVHLSGYYICDESDVSSTENTKKGQMNALSKKFGQKPQTSFTVSANVETSDEESSDVEEIQQKGKVVSPAKKVVSPAKKAPATPSPIALKKNKTQVIVSKEDDTSEEDSSDDEDSEEDEGEDSNKLKNYAIKRVHATVESEEDSSDEEDSSESEHLQKGLAQLHKQPQNKKLKADMSTPIQMNKKADKTPKKSPVVVNLEGNLKTGKPDMNSSIGRTPMPKKNVTSFVQQNSPLDSFLSKMKDLSKSPKEDSSDSEEMEISDIKTPDKKPLTNNQLDTSQSESSKKKRKKKKKAKAAANDSQENINKSPVKPQLSKKLPGGIEYEDIRIGNGLMAKKGKLIHVYYTGRLENNKIFDSCQQGSKPFSFKLAAGDVIKGWDIGLEGMKVGGKRRLKIPPKMAYGNQQLKDIPANSMLDFVVELKAVS